MEGKKRVLLIGANGFVGQHLTKELIKHFHVRALIRSAPKFGINSIFLQFANGDATNQETLEANLDGVDLVVSAFGVPIDNPNGQMTAFAKTLVAAMTNKGVSRLVWIGTAGSLTSPDGKPLWQAADYPEEYRKVSEDHDHAYQVLSASTLNWTTLNPAKTTPATNDGNYKIFLDAAAGDDVKDYVGIGILAKLCTKIALEDLYSKKRVGVCDE